MDLSAITCDWLVLRSNHIDDEGAKALSLNTTLISLFIWDNQIGDEGVKALSLNTTLTTLDLGYNHIGVEGAKALSINTTLTTLYLRNNLIGDEGAKALSLNTTLTSLYIGCNQISDEGAKAFNLNSTLTSLNLTDNDISNKILSEIKTQLSHNRKALEQRRHTLISQLILLNITGTRDNKWSRLVPDVRRMILDMVAEGSRLGTTMRDVKQWGEFVRENIKIIIERSSISQPEAELLDAR